MDAYAVCYNVLLAMEYDAIIQFRSQVRSNLLLNEIITTITLSNYFWYQKFSRNFKSFNDPTINWARACKFFQPYTLKLIDKLLIDASIEGYLDGIRLAVYIGASPSKFNKVLENASRNGHFEIVNLLLQDPRVNPSDQNNKAIALASGYGHLEIVNRLIQDPRVDPSDQNNKAIALARRNGHLKIVNLLLQDPRVNPSDQNNKAIALASENGHFEIVNLLLKDPRVDLAIRIIKRWCRRVSMDILE